MTDWFKGFLRSLGFQLFPLSEAETALLLRMPPPPPLNLHPDNSQPSVDCTQLGGCNALWPHGHNKPFLQQNEIQVRWWLDLHLE